MGFVLQATARLCYCSVWLVWSGLVCVWLAAWSGLVWCGPVCCLVLFVCPSVGPSIYAYMHIYVFVDMYCLIYFIYLIIDAHIMILQQIYKICKIFRPIGK